LNFFSKARRPSNRIGADVGKVQVECHHRPAFALADYRHVGIGLAYHALVANGHGVMACAGKQPGRLGRQVFIDLELEHQVAPVGSGTMRSRARSAA